MPTKKQTSNVRPIKPTGRTTPRGGPEEVIDFDSEVQQLDKDAKPKKFRLRGFDYSLGRGPNPYIYRTIVDDPNFEMTEFLSLFIVESQRKRFLEAVRTGPYGAKEYALLQTRLIEASADRPTEAS